MWNVAETNILVNFFQVIVFKATEIAYYTPVTNNMRGNSNLQKGYRSNYMKDVIIVGMKYWNVLDVHCARPCNMYNSFRI